MKDDIDDIRAYYESTECAESSRLARHQLERDITLRYFDAYLPARGHVLDIGAGTGGCTVWLAERGYQVVAVDLSEKLISQCRKYVSDLGLQTRVRCVVADARDMASVPESDFDAVLLMGPLYHLVLRDNRLKALREALARLKPGGVVFSGLVSRFGIMGHLLRHVRNCLEPKEDEALLDQLKSRFEEAYPEDVEQSA